MIYTYDQVLDILSLVTDQPDVILSKWCDNEDNKSLDLTKYNYPLFLYSFPIIVDGDKVATITLSETTNTGIDHERQSLMSKYLSTDVYRKSWWAYSHDTYLNCYLTIHKEFLKDDKFYVLESSFVDEEGKQIKYRLSLELPYGNSKSKAKELSFEEGTCYHFYNGVNLKIENTRIKGWSMGEKINEVIRIRTRDRKIKSITTN